MFSLFKKKSGFGNEQPWPFDQDRNVAALTTKQVMHSGLPVLQVAHYDDDHSWAFTCGTSDDSEDAMFVQMEQIVAIDPSLLSIADLPPGWSAWRESPSSPWQRYQPDEG